MNIKLNKIYLIMLFIVLYTTITANDLTNNTNEPYNFIDLNLSTNFTNSSIHNYNTNLTNNKTILNNYSNITKIIKNTTNNINSLNHTLTNLSNLTNLANNTVNNHYLKINISNYKTTIYTNGVIYGYSKYGKLKFIKIDNNTYILSPILLNTNLHIYSKKDNSLINKTIFLNYTNKEKEQKEKENTNYLNITFEKYKPIIKTNGKKVYVKYNNLNVNVKVMKINNNEYTFYPVLLNNNITIYSKFNNGEVLNKTLKINENNEYNNESSNNNKKYKYVAYDPVSGNLIIRTKHNDFEKTNKHIKKILDDYQITIPATDENLKKYNLPKDIIKTKIYSKNISKNKMRILVENKLDVWYRFSTKIPKGYKIKKIVGIDGREIVNNISINRTTGEKTGELRWYVENNTLYFYDDPVYGYDISLTPPAPNHSLAIELAYESETGGKCGQISAIVYPYSEGDDSTTISTYDHAGRIYDGGYANNIDEYAGSKIAIKYYRGLFSRQYGNIGTANRYLSEINRTDIPLNTVPNGILESAIVTDMTTTTSNFWKLNITQKLIIRGNNKWFATIYYVKNPSTNTYSDLKFFQGMDWNFRGDYFNDNCYYNSTNDIVYGYDADAPIGDIQVGGFKSNLSSSEHDVNDYLIMWDDILNDALNNQNSYNGDAGVALSWGKNTLPSEEIWVIPIIWGLGLNYSDMTSEINIGLSQLYDTGVKSIDYPNNGDSFNPNTQQIININSTIALYGLVDANNLNVTINVNQIGGTYIFENYTLVNLSVPYEEQKQITFPLNISNIPYGTYNITIKTNLPNDQNISNNNKSIIIKIMSFSVEPEEQTKYGNNGDTVYYNITTYNYGSGGYFDINITQSTKGWDTKLYDNSMNIIAEDSNGDGVWDYINSNYDTNNNNIPDLYIDTNINNITFSKTIPIFAPLGERDATTITFVNINNNNIKDYATLYTKNPTPPSVHKTFYLHGDSQYTLNTTPQTTINDYTTINGNSLKSWAQSPKFAGDFTIFGNISIPLYISSESTANRNIKVSLFYTDGSTSQLLGYDEISASVPTSPTLYNFNILLDSQITIPKNNYLVLRVENQQSTTSINIYHDSSYKSNIILNTTTYVKVRSVKKDKEYYLINDTVKINGNISDPIGSYDIVGANITIYYPNGSIYLKNSMDLNYTDTSSPSFWKDYNYSFKPTVMGIYIVTVVGIESNGVLNNLSNENIICGIPINGYINEDFGTLGTNDTEDIGVYNARVYLFKDVDNNGILTNNDTLVNVVNTDTSGKYQFIVYDNSSNYIVAVNSKTITPYNNINNNYNINETWAEQTYQSQWNGTNYVVSPKFGGQNPNTSDIFGVNYEHYSYINISNYNGELINFGFSFDVVVNTKDYETNIKPIGEEFIIPTVSQNWQTVYLKNYYNDPVIVCSYNLPSSSDYPAVIRIANITNYSFKIKLQNPGDLNNPTPSSVHCIVMEKGNYTLSNGLKVQVGKVVSDGTNENNNWSSARMEHIPYAFSFNQPVVLGQVMSYNDPKWSVFWCSNGNRVNPPDSSNLYIGKHVGEDTDTTRNNEVLGYIILENSNGIINNIKYSAVLGGNTIYGINNTPPYQYNLLDNFAIGIITQNTMHGNNGGWAILYGSNPVSNTLNLAIDEDQIHDLERWHVAEQVAYWVFNQSGILTINGSPNYGQGTLRQFITNANTIKNENKLKFIPMVSPNSGTGNNKWWTIKSNNTIGALPDILDNNTVIDGTAYYQNMTVRDDNFGLIGTGGTVGTGRDNIPNSGDEVNLTKYNRTELEINGNNNDIFTIGNGTVNPSNVVIRKIAIYNRDGGNGIYIYGGCNNFTIENNIIGLRANGSYTPDRIKYGIRINDHTLPSIGGKIQYNYIGYCREYNIIVGYSSVNSNNPINTIIKKNEIFYGGYGQSSTKADNIAIYSNNVTIKENLIRDSILNNDYLNSGKGIEIRYNSDNVNIINNTIKNSQSCGILYSDDSDDGLIKNNIIFNNSLSGIVISDASGSPNRVIISKNSIYNNGRLGIDLDDNSNYGDNISLNDGSTSSARPNYGVDYPIITDAKIDGDNLTLSGFINSGSSNTGNSNFANAIVEIYLVKNTTTGDNLIGNNISSDGTILDNTYGEGYLYLGTLVADSNGNFNGTINISNKGIGDESLITATTTLPNYGTSEFGRNYIIFNKYYHLLGTIYNINSGYNISIKSYNNTNNIYVYWYKPNSIEVINISGDYDLNGTYGNTYWFKFNNINTNETKNITINTNITTMDGLIIGIDPQ